MRVGGGQRQVIRPSRRLEDALHGGAARTGRQPPPPGQIGPQPAALNRIKAREERAAELAAAVPAQPAVETPPPATQQDAGVKARHVARMLPWLAALFARASG